MRVGLGKLAAIAGALVLLATCGDGTDRSAPDGGGSDTGSSEGSARLFDPTVVHDVEMEIADADLDRLEPPTDQRVPVRLTVDDVTVADAGVRLKGGASQHQGLDAKPGFSIKTDELVDDRYILGVARFTLGNAALDGSFVAEHLAYLTFRDAGIPVARTALARVTVNNETFGLYVMRESYDKRWLARHFEDPEGNLYEDRKSVV